MRLGCRPIFARDASVSIEAYRDWGGLGWDITTGARTLSLQPNIALAASLIADPARAAMLSVLLDGRALPAGELAYAAGVTARRPAPISGNARGRIAGL